MNRGTPFLCRRPGTCPARRSLRGRLRQTSRSPTASAN